jgi:hypothetical protein
MVYCFQLGYGTREFGNISSTRSRSDFIMQNYSMKAYGIFLAVCIKFARIN